MNYEGLLDEAYSLDLVVKEVHLSGNKGRLKGNRIAIKKDIPTLKEKACILAEELGHHYTTVGNILDQKNAINRKQELKARIIAYNKQVGLLGIIDAYEANCRCLYDMAEHLDVTEEFLLETLKYYKGKYGEFTRLDNYIIYFEPNLGVMKLL
ncbi:hypothetical protein QA584_22865 [Anaerocolumna sp. AGMB13025]|nr:hypothetical protein [Anaerocolumna sp. AGMB13025]WFR56427.1 hypothetical protein QA584_22865 [Anaerocolumna sp. AGMB13025]